MAKKRPRKPEADTEKRDTKQLRLEAAFLRRLALVASGLGMSPGEYVENRLAPILARDFREVAKGFGLEEGE